MSLARRTRNLATHIGVLLTCAMVTSSCDQSKSAQFLDKGASQDPSSAGSPEARFLTSYDRVLETRALNESIGLDCESWSTPFLPRIPAHILLQGAKSDKLYLRKDWLVWYVVPVLLGSLREAQPTCTVSTDESSGNRQIQCPYFEGLMRRKRLLTIPLVAKKIGTFISNDSKPDHENWYVFGAHLTGPNIYRNSNKVDLVCQPRAPEFGYKVMTIDEVKQVQPWDGITDIRATPQENGSVQNEQSTP